uniref:phospholipase A2 isozymes PA3A/PA3B/PA5-like isoform X2 n=1 Tax=Myxine glutinosa TaxID=7769 RepID=UPI00358EFD64
MPWDVAAAARVVLRVRARRSADSSARSTCGSDQCHVTHLVPRDPARERSRRALVYPGTLWCGAGSLASNYDELGEHIETDVCCREHDHCPHTVAAFESKYGFLNYRWYTILHCSCDFRFRQCLHKANSTASRVIGQAYFNVISVPCFTFEAKETCARRTWWGWHSRMNL